MILAGDIGGTKTVLALFEPQGSSLRLVRDGTFPSRAHATFDGILVQFLKEDSNLKLKAGYFGVAGAVIDGKSHTTNLPSNLDESELASVIHAPRVKLLNDLEAAAYGMLFLKPDELCQLHPGAATQRTGKGSGSGAGTELGRATVY